MATQPMVKASWVADLGYTIFDEVKLFDIEQE